MRWVIAKLDQLLFCVRQNHVLSKLTCRCVHEKSVAETRHTSKLSKLTTERLAAGFQSLHCKILAHRFGDSIALFSSLNAPLGEVLDLGASVSWVNIAIEREESSQDIPVLKPNLYGSLGHVDLDGNLLPN